MNIRVCTLLVFTLALASVSRAAELLPGAHRVVFLGDSITYSGQYVDDVEAYVLTHEPGRNVEILDLGLPSETVSGLSEPNHADGKFPRPTLHERLTRVLARTKPDVIFACYGMNDGIYLPLAEERFAKFREGMEKLHAAAEASGAKIIHLTPPVYDPVPLKGKPTNQDPNYDSVLTKYSEWLMEQRGRGWKVIDLHTPMAKALAEARKTNPGFSFSKDGVHADFMGHRVMATALLQGMGAQPEFPTTPAFAAFLKLIHNRARILSDAWLTACGHLRPGMSTGLPLLEAQAKAEALRPAIVEAAKEF